jgi:hypothetical protein
MFMAVYYILFILIVQSDLYTFISSKGHTIKIRNANYALNLKNTTYLALIPKINKKS